MRFNVLFDDSRRGYGQVIALVYVMRGTLHEFRSGLEEQPLTELDNVVEGESESGLLGAGCYAEGGGRRTGQLFCGTTQVQP